MKCSLIFATDEGKTLPPPSSAVGQVPQLKPSVPIGCTGKVFSLLLYYIILFSVANTLRLTRACSEVLF